METSNNNVRLNVSPLSVIDITVNQLKGTVQARIEQVTTSYYGVPSSSKSLGDLDEYETKPLDSKDNVWLRIPNSWVVGCPDTTGLTLTQKINVLTPLLVAQQEDLVAFVKTHLAKELPNAYIQKILSTQPYFDADAQSAIANGLTTAAILAEKRLLRNAKKEEILFKDKYYSFIFRQFMPNKENANKAFIIDSRSESNAIIAKNASSKISVNREETVASFEQETV
jgi:hypothetical protein